MESAKDKAWAALERGKPVQILVPLPLLMTAVGLSRLFKSTLGLLDRMVEMHGRDAAEAYSCMPVLANHRRVLVACWCSITAYL